MLTRQSTQRLRDALEQLDARPRPTEACPPGEILLAAVRAELDPLTLHAVGEHAIACEPCAEGWGLARAIVSGALPAPAVVEPTAAAEDARPRTALPLAPAASFGRWGISLSAVALAAMAVALWIPSAPSGEGGPDAGAAVADEPILSRLAAGAPLPRRGCVLRWSGPAGARYRVTVATADLRPLIESPEIGEEAFEIPPEALARIAPGTRIVWQVTARLPAGGEILSPHFTVPVD